MAKGKGGAPPRYKRASEIQGLIEQYLKDCEGKPYIDDDGLGVIDKNGQPIIVGQKPPTITGLALALGFTSRQALLNYQAKPEFVDTITRAKSRIEEYAERRLFDRDGQRGAEFSLKYNFKWGDASEMESARADSVRAGLQQALEQAAEVWKDGDNLSSDV